MKPFHIQFHYAHFLIIEKIKKNVQLFGGNANKNLSKIVKSFIFHFLLTFHHLNEKTITIWPKRKCKREHNEEPNAWREMRKKNWNSNEKKTEHNVRLQFYSLIWRAGIKQHPKSLLHSFAHKNNVQIITMRANNATTKISR